MTVIYKSCFLCTQNHGHVHAAFRMLIGCVWDLTPIVNVVIFLYGWTISNFRCKILGYVDLRNEASWTIAAIKSSMYKWRRKSTSFNILQHSDGLSNSTGTNELHEVISCTRITQVLPTYFKFLSISENFYQLRTFSTLIKGTSFHMVCLHYYF